MSLYKIQGAAEKRKGIYYEFDTADEPLGEGGMGKVFKGRCVDEKTGSIRNVAVKFMYSDLPPYAIEKARREAAIHFRHDNLIEMLGFIETEERNMLGEVQHRYHVVSELLVGVSLDHLFEGKLTDQQGHFVPFAEKLFKDYHQDPCHFAVELTRSILSGLMAMHDAGYIHRDIDPTNIMVTSDGHIKLIDFGIAKKMNSLTTHDKHLTQTGQFVGKPEYAAPELVLGAINEQNQTTDIYAVGILLFQLIVGHVPFEGDRTDILQKQVHSPLPLRLVKHVGLRKIIAKATEKSRAKRYQSAAEFRVALDQLKNEKINVWRSMYNYVLLSLAICATAVAFWVNKNTIEDVSHQNSEIVDQAESASTSFTYASAVAQLRNPATSKKGFEALTQLSSEGDTDAMYLLSRLYFKSKIPDDYCPDSIRSMQEMLNIVPDNHKAHRLLQDVVRRDPHNYQALYELACDYWKADQRTDAVSERNGELAERFFTEACTYAKKANDNLYEGMIDAYMDRIREWKANLKKINNR